MEQQPFGNQFANPRMGVRPFGPADLAAENARFMSRVYGWMTGGLCLTGAVAWNVSGNPVLVQFDLWFFANHHVDRVWVFEGWVGYGNGDNAFVGEHGS